MLDDAALDTLFRTARTTTSWQDREVPDDLLRQLYELVKLAPTSANCSPARFVFVRSTEAKEKLKPALSGGNVAKVMSAPVTVIVAHDENFYDKLSILYPYADAKPWFTSNYSLAHDTAFRNGSLQGAYLIMAARALGLDAGPMSGFDNSKVDFSFFPGGTWRSNFLINLGYGEREGLQPRLPRLLFEEACRLD